MWGEHDSKCDEVDAVEYTWERTDALIFAFDDEFDQDMRRASRLTARLGKSTMTGFVSASMRMERRLSNS
jgi:hypothetical protein